ncbi:MAG: hypothetical protein ACO1SV_21225 [Fimbriimonas sp.]
MSKLAAFLAGCFTILVAVLGSQAAIAQVARTPDGKVQTVLDIPKGTVSIPQGGMAVLSDDQYLYIFRAGNSTVTRVSKTRIIDGKPETYRMELP